MTNSKFIHFLFLFLFLSLIIFASSSSLKITQKCSKKQSHALLLFKQNHSSNDSDNESCPDCVDYGDYLVTENWNTNLDCCDWNGVTCDNTTGDVIGLDLNSGMLQGTIYSNSSLFHLPQLRTLNLAFNDFTGELPHEIGIFSNSLTHLNISQCSFNGKVPPEISLLHKLVSLDLSQNSLKLQPHSFINLLRNSTVLEQLSLGGVNISSVLPAYLNISSSLKLLDLSSTGLQGKLPPYFFNLQSLEKLDLSFNSFTGNIPSQITLLSNLVSLNLSDNLLEDLPIQPHNYNALLRNSTFLKYLASVRFSHNNLNGTLPSWLFSLPSLEYIYLDGNMLSGNLPFNLFSLHSLKVLSISNNKLFGQIDVLDQGPEETFQQLTNLTLLDLSYNDFRGDWELDILLSRLIKLVHLQLSHNSLSVTTNNARHYVNPMFYQLGLASCKITVLPEFLRTMKNLQYLDLSDNQIHGTIPYWAGGIGGDNLYYLNLANNSISRLPQFQWDGLTDMYLQSNKIQGPFPLSICNMKNLMFLDMSNNSFDGPIPKCFGNLTSSLASVNLRNNHFHGTIPNEYDNCGRLEGFILNGNQFEGEVPSFLSKCWYLIVLDLGSNHLNGTFPHWLGDLPYLQVLVLKSNNFHGTIVTSSTSKPQFQCLQVLDLSNNGFVGELPRKYFQNFKAMKVVVKNSTKLQYRLIGVWYYSITITVKGVVQNFPRIFAQNIIIDVSKNKFHGEIPNIIGSLISLKMLNLSHNNLTGQIPHSLGNLSEIESLDLSSNKLIGEIPGDLANIKGLAFLNLSQNNLVGRIPEGKQFNTFDTGSFEGNLGLCGFPLLKCEPSNSPQPKVDGYDDDDDHDDDCV